MRRPVGFALLAVLLPFGRVALADSPTAPPQEAPVATSTAVSGAVVAFGKGQDALGVGIAGSELVARVCSGSASKDAAKGASPSCDPLGGTTIRPPSSIKTFVHDARLRKVRTSQGKELVEAIVDAGERRWIALIVAGDGNPRIAWSGFAVHATPPPPKGVDYVSERDTSHDPSFVQYQVQKDGGGEKISITRFLALCGKSTGGGRAVLDPRSLEMQNEALDDPAPEARRAAIKVTAKKVPSPSRSVGLLHTPRASSGSAAALIDGNPTTSWTEEAPGVGQNQFVAMSAPDSVSVLGFDLDFATPADLAGARAPKNMLLVTEDKSFLVELPENAVESSSASFSVELATPLHTRCVGLVLGDAYPAKADDNKAGKGSAAGATTFVSELSLRTRFEGSTADDLAQALKGGGDEARARADMLSAAGHEGVSAAIRAYPGLDGPGQDLARRVIDASSCSEKLPLYVPMLASKDEDAESRAHDRVRRCGKEAAPALLAELDSHQGEARSVFAEELALLSPDVAVPALVAGLSKATTALERLLFRRALVKASDRDSSVKAFEAALAPEAFAPLGMDAKLDLLRAAGKRLGETKRGGEAFREVAKEASDFRGRYLLLGPAAALARGGDREALTALTTSLAKDPDARIRARAAEVAIGISSLDEALLEAAKDPAVRVREAATRSIEGKKLIPKAQVRLVAGLPKEPWTFVRRAMVQALAGMRGDAQVDATLAVTMEHEEQPNVRQDILFALGARGAKSQRQAIKDRAGDMGEVVDVRVEALKALGQVCDAESLDDLTKIALKGATPFMEADRKLSTAAISALGRLHPKDLAVRLAPLQTEKVPGDVRESARAALNETHVCH